MPIRAGREPYTGSFRQSRRQILEDRTANDAALIDEGLPIAHDPSLTTQDRLLAASQGAITIAEGDIAATDASNGKLRIDQGFQMIALGVDCTILIKSLSQMMDALGKPLDGKVWKGQVTSRMLSPHRLELREKK